MTPGTSLQFNYCFYVTNRRVMIEFVIDEQIVVVRSSAMTFKLMKNLHIYVKNVCSIQLFLYTL